MKFAIDAKSNLLQLAHMPKQPAKNLKVMLDEKNSKFVREAAELGYTTPPRLVNKIVDNHIADTRLPAPRPKRR